MRRTLAPVIVLILAFAVHGCAKIDPKMDKQLGTTRPVTSFPIKAAPVDADYFILSDVSNSGLFTRSTVANTKTALGIALDSSGFNKNLTTNDDTLQEIVDKFDGLVFAPAMGADDNYVTDAEKTVIGNTSGTNTGDQTTVSGTAGGLAAQYIDWNAGSGGASIANKPTIPTASDTAYDATTWDASTAVPTKNAIRDEIETFPTLTFGTGLTETDGTVTVTPNTYQPLDTDLTAAAGAGSATNSTFFGKDAGGTVGFHSVSAGSFALDTYPAYEDSPHSGSGIAENGTTVAMYSPTTGKWMTIATMADTLDPAPAGISDDFSSDTTANYTNIIQTLSISGGVAHGTVKNNTVAYHETTTGGNDHWVSATCTAGDTDSACVMLGSNGTDYYFSEFAGGVFKIWSSVGSYSVVYNGSYADGAHTVAIQIDTDGSSHPRFNAWIDGVQRITNDSDTADSITRGPYVGLRFDRGTTGVDVTVDNLAAGSGVYTP